MRTVPRTFRFPAVAALALCLALPALCVRPASASGPSQAGGLPALAARIADLEAETAAQDARIALLEGDNAALAAVLTIDTAGDLVVTGANLRLRSGAGSTTAPANGKGNLIVGYDESSGDTKTGSHNLVIGPFHTYTSHGGLVAGSDNRIDAPFASVSGGSNNRASGFASSVSGGFFNVAAGDRSSVTGGRENLATGPRSSVNGGFQNTAAGTRSTIAGGFNCLQLGLDAWGSGASLGPLGVFPVGITSPIFFCP